MCYFQDNKFGVRIKIHNLILFGILKLGIFSFFFIEKAMIWKLFGLLKGLPHEADQFILENVRYMTILKWFKV